MPSKSAFLVSLFLVFCTSAARAASPQSEIAANVHELYARYADGDFARFREMWAGGAVPSAKIVENTMRTKCIKVLQLEIDAIDVRNAETEAEVAATLTIRKSSRADGKARTEHRHPRIHYVLRDGRWIADDWDSEEERVARAIGDAASDADAWDNLACAEADGAVNESLVRELSDRAVLLVNRNRLDAASRVIGMLNRLAERDGDPYLLARARTTEGIVARIGKNRDLQRSVALSQEALRIAERSDDADLIAFTLLNLGRAMQFRDGNLLNAEPFFRRILEYEGSLEEANAVSRAALQVASARLDRGDYRSALIFTQKAQSVLDLPTDYNGWYSTEVTFGVIYMRQGDYELAIPRFRHALDLAIEIPFPSGAAAAIAMLADCYRSVGDTKQFRATAAEAQRLAMASAFPEDDLGSTLTDVALDAIDRNDLVAAEKALKEAMPHAERSRTNEIHAGAISAMALLRLRQHRYADALKAAADVGHLLEFETAQQRFDVAVIAAKAHRALGDKAAAEAALRQTIDASEKARSEVVESDRIARLFFNSRVSAYLELVDLLVDENRVREALQVAERAKSRTLLDLMATGSQRARVLPDAERLREDELAAAVRTANRAVEDARANKSAADAWPHLEAALQDARLALERFHADLAVRHPLLPLQLGDAVAPPPAEMIAVVPEDMTAVEYVVTDTRLHIFTIAHAAHREPRVRVHSVAIDRAAFEKMIQQLVGRIANRDLDYRRGARQLYDLLLGPIEQEIASTTALQIVPAGALWSLPFEALRDVNGRFLVERKTISYMPSLTVWQMLRGDRTAARNVKQSAFLGIGNPNVDAAIRATVRGDLGPLPEAETEVRTISKMFEAGRAEVLVGASAGEQRIKEESPSFRVLHFATHARIDDRNPMYSHIVLARGRGGYEEDGLLEAWEMMQLDLHADLAVLSACDTARGGADAGEGVIGMTWALLAAGCRSTIASEWKVPSAATSDLMISFYDRWLHDAKPHIRKARALRDARLKMLRDPRRSHPYYWAAFVLVGDAE